MTMYNPYIEDTAFVAIEEGAPLESPEALESSPPSIPSLQKILSIKDSLSKMGEFTSLFSGKKPPPEGGELLSEEGGESTGFLQEWRKKLHLDDLDSGDVLLILIVIYLMIEGDDKIELAITMGILAFMWFLDVKSKEPLSKEDGTVRQNKLGILEGFDF